MDVDDDLANSESAQAGERDFEERAAIDFDQRLRAIGGERTQACAQAGCENHRFHSSFTCTSTCAYA